MARIGLIFVPSVRIGGAEGVLLKITKGILPFVEEVHVVFLTGDHVGKWENIKSDKVFFHLTEKTKERYGVLPAMNIIRKLSSQHQVEYSFSSHTHCNSLLGIMRKVKLLKSKQLIFRESMIISENYSGLKHAVFKLFYYFCYKKYDLIICQSNQMMQSLFIDFKWLDRSKITTILNPIDLEEIERQVSNSNQLPLPFDHFMVAAGRFGPEKGFDVLLKAFSKYRKAGGDLDLLILGDGRERHNLEALIMQFGLTEHVSMPGKVNDPCYYFQKAKLGVISSRHEGFPNVLLEMMAVCPMVVSTLCADGIQNLPKIGTCEPTNVKALFQLLFQAGNNLSDFSVEYEAELKGRTIPAFIKEILFHIEK